MLLRPAGISDHVLNFIPRNSRSLTHSPLTTLCFFVRYLLYWSKYSSLGIRFYLVIPRPRFFDRVCLPRPLACYKYLRSSSVMLGLCSFFTYLIIYLLMLLLIPPPFHSLSAVRQSSSAPAFYPCQCQSRQVVSH